MDKAFSRIGGNGQGIFRNSSAVFSDLVRVFG